MKEKLIKLLDEKNNRREDYIKESRNELAKIMSQRIFYDIDTCYELGILTYEEKKDLEEKYNVRFGG